MRQNDSGNLRELFTSARFQIVFGRIEEDIGHIDDQAPRGIARFEDSVELLDQLLPQLLLFALGLFSSLPCAAEFRLSSLTLASGVLSSGFGFGAVPVRFSAVPVRFGTCSLSLSFGLSPLRFCPSSTLGF